MPSSTATLALLALIVLAGCSGASGPGAMPTSEAIQPTPTATPSEPTTTVPTPEVIDHEDLPIETQRSVRAAIENGSVLRDSDAFDGLNPRKEQYVRYDGETYALVRDTMHARAEYGLDDVERVIATSLRSGSTVVAYANLSERGRRIFHRALNGSRPRMYGLDSFPSGLFENGYVEYRGTPYRLTVGHGDIPQWELRVEEFDGPSDGLRSHRAGDPRVLDGLATPFSASQPKLRAMADPSEPSETSPASGSGEADGRRAGELSGDPEATEEGSVETAGVGDAEPSRDPETLREQVEERYDFEHFSPADMAEMTVEEWEAAFDADSWITGPELLDRVEADLRSRVARREVFAVVERTEVDGEEHVLAYTDVGYALVAQDGTIEGEGSIREDVEPVVALCSMADYDVPEPPADGGLPHPDEIADGAGSLGDRLLLALAGVQIVAGLLLLVSPIFLDLNPDGPAGGAGLLTTVAGLGFLFIGVVIGVLVANARLSGRFRAEEYRQRLRAAGVGTDERPGFLPGEGGSDGAENAADDRSETAPD